MERMCVHGTLVPLESMTVTNQYIGHFIQIIYIQKAVGQNIFKQNLIDVKENGEFEFLIPKKLSSNEMIVIEIYAADGELLKKLLCDSGNFKDSAIAVNIKSTYQEVEIGVNPKMTTCAVDSPSLIAKQTMQERAMNSIEEPKHLIYNFCN